MDFNDRNRGILGIRFEFIDRIIDYLINRFLFNLTRLLLVFIDCIIDLDITLILLFVRTILSSMIDINSAAIYIVIMGLEVFAILVCKFGGEFELTNIANAD